MRMWMVNPKLMCNKHLLGEHVELHMLVGCINKGKSITGFIENDLVFPIWIIERHNDIVNEMTKRKFNHKSYLADFSFFFQLSKLDFDNICSNNLKELSRRCKECRILQKKSE